MSEPRTVRLDSGNARVSFSVRWFGVLHVGGWFTGITGSLGVPGPAGEEAAVLVQVDGASVRTGIALRDRHLRGPRFLDSGPHPIIRFVSREVSRNNGSWELTGTLSLRGRDRAVSVTVPDEYPSNGERRLVAQFTVPRRQHGIGAARGIRRLNPLLWAIADYVTVRVEVKVPATLLQPAMAHARAR